jgi:hypothetical protein
MFLFSTKLRFAEQGNESAILGQNWGKTTNSSRAEQKIPKSFKKLLKTLQNTLQNTFGLFDSNSTAHSLSKLQFTKVVYS